MIWGSYVPHLSSEVNQSPLLAPLTPGHQGWDSLGARWVGCPASRPCPSRERGQCLWQHQDPRVGALQRSQRGQDRSMICLDNPVRSRGLTQETFQSLVVTT